MRPQSEFKSSAELWGYIFAKIFLSLGAAYIITNFGLPLWLATILIFVLT